MDCANTNKQTKKKSNRPAELPGMVHVGSSFNVAFVRVVDGGSSSVCSSKDEDKAVEAHSRSVLVI